MKIFRRLFRIFCSIVAAPFMIYLYNLIAAPFDLIIPINLFSVLVVGFLGMPGLVTVLLLLICV